MAGQNLQVYAGPNPNFALIGSVSNETVFPVEGVTSESAYAYIEYATASGQKRGYVLASGLQALPGLYATMAGQAVVYNGPHDSNYASAGSVDQGEPVQVLGKEKTWFYIQYATATNQKRGYVPYDSLNNAAVMAGQVEERIFTGSADITNQELTAYTGPNTSFAASGTVYAGEGVTRLTKVPPMSRTI